MKHVRILKKIIEIGLKEVIVATIYQKLNDIYEETDISGYMRRFNNRDGDVPLEIITLCITVSYNMGWQKRRKRYKYDIISGHGLIIVHRTRKMFTNQACI